MNYTSFLSDISVKSEESERFEFEMFAFIYMSLSHDCLYFKLIGCCTGCKHKQVMVGNSVLLTGALGTFLLSITRRMGL